MKSNDRKKQKLNEGKGKAVAVVKKKAVNRLKEVKINIPGRILVVDDDEEVCLALEDILHLHDFTVTTVPTAAKALEILQSSASFDLVLTDLVMPRIDGIALTKEINAMGLDVPVVVMTGYASIEYAVESMKAGASDFITKPFNYEQVIFIINRNLENQRIRKMAREREYYRELSNIDALTTIGNYRYFDQVLQMEIERQKRYNRPLTLMIIDIDDFKRYNDTYGHLIGDLVLTQVAAILKNSIRGCDFVARYGGEEFVVVLHEITGRRAIRVGDRILSAVDTFDYLAPEGHKLGKITVTIGMASFPKDADEKKEFIRKADLALYTGKQAGKNCLCVYGQKGKIIRLKEKPLRDPAIHG
jgi:two-component system, cell cycle response regulator